MAQRKTKKQKSGNYSKGKDHSLHLKTWILLCLFLGLIGFIIEKPTITGFLTIIPVDQIKPICDSGSVNEICIINTTHQVPIDANLEFNNLEIKNGGSLQSDNNFKINSKSILLEKDASITASELTIKSDSATIEGIIDLSGKSNQQKINPISGLFSSKAEGASQDSNPSKPHKGSKGGNANLYFSNYIAQGGNGGGYLELDITDLTIEGNIDISGKNGDCKETKTLKRKAVGGGGSGGSVLIITTNLKGSGSIKAIGGPVNNCGSKPGESGIVTIYSTNNNFNGIINTVIKIIGSAINPTLNLEPQTLEPTNEFNIEGSLLIDGYHYKIPYTPVTINFNQNTFETTTDQEGNFNFKTTAPPQLGDFEIEINSNLYNIQGKTSSTLSVTDLTPPEIIENINNKNPKINDKILLNFNIKDIIGLQKIDVYKSINEKKELVLTKNLQGNEEQISHELLIDIPNNNEINILAIASDTSNNEQELSTIITVADTPSEINIEPILPPKKLEDFTISVKTEDQDSLKSGIIEYSVEGKNINEAFTQTIEGISTEFSSTFKIDAEKGDSVNIKVKVIDSGDSIIEKSTTLSIVNSPPSPPNFITPKNNDLMNKLNVKVESSDIDNDNIIAYYYIDDEFIKLDNTEASINSIDGQHDLKVSVFDGEAFSPNTSILINIDSTAPEVILNKKSTVTEKNNYILEGSLKDLNGIKEITITQNDNNIPVNFNEQTKEFSANFDLQEGLNPYVITTSDLIGNKEDYSSELEGSTIILDTLPPQIFLIEPDNKGTLIEGESVILQIKDLKIKDVTYSINRATPVSFNGNYELIPSPPSWNQGTNTLKVIAEDHVGKTTIKVYNFDFFNDYKSLVKTANNHIDKSIEDLKSAKFRFTDADEKYKSIKSFPFRLIEQEYTDLIESLKIIPKIDDAINELNILRNKIQSIDSSSDKPGLKRLKINSELDKVLIIKNEVITDIEVLFILKTIEGEDANEEFVNDILEQIKISGEQVDISNNEFKSITNLLQKETKITTIASSLNVKYLNGKDSFITFYDKDIQLPITLPTFFINEHIDKNIRNDNNLRASRDITNLGDEGEYSILQDDPIIRWKFNNKKSANIKYTIEGEIPPENLNQADTIVSVEPLAEISNADLKNAIEQKIDFGDLSVKDIKPIELIIPSDLDLLTQDKVRVPIIIINTQNNPVNNLNLEFTTNSENTNVNLANTVIKQLASNEKQTLFAEISTQSDSPERVEISFKINEGTNSYSKTSILNLKEKTTSSKSEFNTQMQAVLSLFSNQTVCEDFKDLESQSKIAFQDTNILKALSLYEASIRSCNEIARLNIGTNNKVNKPQNTLVNKKNIVIGISVFFVFSAYLIWNFINRRKRN